MVDVDLLLASMTSKQLSEWVAFYSLEPFGQEWLQTGTISAIIAETHRNKKLKSDPYQAEDFIPREKDPDPSPDELKDKARMIFAAWSRGSSK